MAHWLNGLERKFGRLGVPRLITYVVAGRGLAYLLGMGDPAFPAYLVLDPDAVRRGEAWRIATYVFTPPGGGLFFALIELYFTYLIGDALEAAWGAFRFTLYYLIGALATAAVAFLVTGSPVTPTYLNLSLFLAFATLFPEFTVLLFFILPVKVKYLGWITAGYLTIDFWTTSLTGKAAIFVALGNYLLFFAPQIREWVSGRFHRTGSDLRNALAGERPGGARASRTVHRCAACGRTERDDPALEFRVCTCDECGGGTEYCMEHLAAHRKSGP